MIRTVHSTAGWFRLSHSLTLARWLNQLHPHPLVEPDREPLGEQSESKPIATVPEDP